jgi:hypothetical protein
MTTKLLAVYERGVCAFSITVHEQDLKTVAFYLTAHERCNILFDSS